MASQKEIAIAATRRLRAPDMRFRSPKKYLAILSLILSSTLQAASYPTGVAFKDFALSCEFKLHKYNVMPYLDGELERVTEFSKKVIQTLGEIPSQQDNAFSRFKIITAIALETNKLIHQQDKTLEDHIRIQTLIETAFVFSEKDLRTPLLTENYSPSVDIKDSLQEFIQKKKNKASITGESPSFLWVDYLFEKYVSHGMTQLAYKIWRNSDMKMFACLATRGPDKCFPQFRQFNFNQTQYQKTDPVFLANAYFFSRKILLNEESLYPSSDPYAALRFNKLKIVTDTQNEALKAVQENLTRSDELFIIFLQKTEQRKKDLDV